MILRDLKLGCVLAGTGLFVLTGCAQPPAPAPVVVAPPAVEPTPVSPAVEPDAPAVEKPAALGGKPTDAQLAERRAAEAVKAIDDLLAGRAASQTPPEGSPAAPSGPPQLPAAAPAVEAIVPPPIPVERPRPPTPVPAAPESVAPAPIVPTPIAPAAPPEDPAKPSVANTAMSVTPPDGSPDAAPVRAAPPSSPRPISDAVEQQIADRAKQNPRDIAAQLDQQLLMLAHGQPVPTPTSLAGMAGDDKQMLTTLMDGLSNFRATVAADPNALMTRKIRPLVDMTDRLSSESDLTLPKAALCSEVKNYGVYTPIEPARFPAMTPASVVVYCEVANFTSTLDVNNMYVTRW